MDSFAAALSKGACLKRLNLKEAVRIGIIFGAIEFVTPLLGWALGYVASSYVMAWDHWIIFFLLSLLGGRMILAGLNADYTDECLPPERHGAMVLVLTAIATSLDALAVGIGLAFLQVNILLTSLMIGSMTAIMATFAVILGRFIGPILGRWSEILGGLVLIGIGTTILLQHLGFLS